jgi:hypothetical protein
VVIGQAALGPKPLEHDAQDRVRHRGELHERLVRVEAHVEVHLGHPVGAAEGVARVQEHRDLDRVAGGERQPLEQRAP